MTTIANINITAPIWSGAPESDLRAIMAHLGNASFHFADDSGGEWGAGKAQVVEAAKIANRHKLCAAAVRALHREASPLVSENDWLDAVLKGARESQGESVA
jgi:hypothetical protein